MTDTDPALVTLTHPRSPAAEAYRTLRTNVQFAGGEQAVRTMLITSAGPDEGKSAAAANLAITLAQADHSVILVDSDLRRPVQHRLFGLQSQPGLADMLALKARTPRRSKRRRCPSSRCWPAGRCRQTRPSCSARRA